MKFIFGMAGLDVAHAGARLAVRNDHGSKTSIIPMACILASMFLEGRQEKSSDALGSLS
jgi:hypothetical protein